MPTEMNGSDTLRFKTMGNATIQLRLNDEVLLTTDPWLTGRAYFDSWALHHPFSEEEIQSVKDSEYLWISHGHPDHLHHESLELLPKGKKVLIPNHYHDEISEGLKNDGFEVEVMQYKKWYRLHEKLEILCLDNINQDGILIMRFGDALLINLNDSPLCGEFSFIRNLVKEHPNDKVYVFKLVGIGADMLNYVDEHGNRTIEAPENYKMGCIQDAANEIHGLGGKYFCISSSQHFLVRSDSMWVNDYEFTYKDMCRHWNQPSVQVVPPFVTCDLGTGDIHEDWPSQKPDESQFLGNTGQDDWDEKLSEEEWKRVFGFFQQFETIYDIVDFIDVEVGGEKRRVLERKKQRKKPRGVCFFVPRNSLLETVEWGYFDDLLIGNFMKTQLINMTLYPDFSPRVAKYGGNAKVFSKRDLQKMYRHYFWRNPIGVAKYMFNIYWWTRFVRYMADVTEAVGIRKQAKWFYLTLKKLKS
ncbi:hypothetical protein KFE96_01580 [Kordiimonas sp. SCSIO 12603]|uniref:hypothetical protein n=1 Tax=Kordiimonas sp. SCSIO 12603 TaxID=2829596 RepID=UPI002105556F|nr:hypothetical protein [Kordiimonas sp. SCSIO 12603]UTW59025.1 hypothetical protein KFE96_01580 [Kordiimonas sp. SCSIO 12603]